MKKYAQPATRVFATLSVVCLCIIIVGILLIFFFTNHIKLILFFFGIGVPCGLLFFILFLICIRCYLLIDDKSISFHITRVPKLRFRRNYVLFDNIQYIEKFFHKGDGIISKDTYMYKFVLKTGLEFTETFFSYGKEAEQDILNIFEIKQRLI